MFSCHTGGAVYSPAITDFTFMVKVQNISECRVVYLCKLTSQSPECGKKQQPIPSLCRPHVLYVMNHMCKHVVRLENNRFYNAQKLLGPISLHSGSIAFYVNHYQFLETFFMAF